MNDLPDGVLSAEDFIQLHQCFDFINKHKKLITWFHTDKLKKELKKRDAALLAKANATSEKLAEALRFYSVEYRYDNKMPIHDDRGKIAKEALAEYEATK